MTTTNPRRRAPLSGDLAAVAERFADLTASVREAVAATARGGLPEPFEWVSQSRQGPAPTIMIRNKRTRQVAVVVSPDDWTDE